MKKNKILLLVAVLSLLALAGCKKDAEDVTDEKKSDVTATVEVEASTDDKVEEDTQSTEESKPVEETTKEKTDGGGNENSIDSKGEATITTIAILVSENEYFYDNKPVGLDDIVKLIEDANGKVIVELTDNKATYKVYSGLIEKLEELEVEYVEK